MKIKTVVFWILWVGNDFTLQTIGERNDQLYPVLRAEQPTRLNTRQNIVDSTYNNLGVGPTGINLAY